MLRAIKSAWARGRGGTGLVAPPLGRLRLGGGFPRELTASEVRVSVRHPQVSHVLQEVLHGTFWQLLPKASAPFGGFLQMP